MNKKITDLNAVGVEVVAVLADTEERAKTQMDVVKPNYQVGYR